MAKVLWSDRAEADLKSIRPLVMHALVRAAEETLHCVEVCTADEGAVGEIMWRRGITHEQENQMESEWLLEDDEDDGSQAWDYFLIYRAVDRDLFEVLRIVSTREIASRWAHEYKAT